VKVLVDTCVWSVALRRKETVADATVAALTEIVEDGRTVMIGAIRQELLSGISDAKQFKKLKEYLAAFDDLPLGTAVYETAADFCNVCRRRGVQGASVDFLICAAAHAYGCAIMTVDADFSRYAKYVPVTLYR
jgi:predicted nucleic acid-binding protein